MSNPNDALRDEIGFLRALAEDGRQAPLPGGSVLVTAGAIFATCSLASWAGVTYALDWDGFFPLVWLGGVAALGAVVQWAKRRLPAAGVGQRVTGLAWTASGWAILAMALSLAIVSRQTDAWWLMGLLPSLILTLYGVVWFIAAAMTRRGWMQLVAFAAFAMALVCAGFVRRPDVLYLIYAGAMLGLLSLPGAVMIRQARAA